MRPVRRGTSPRATDFVAYEDARTELIARLGHYCSYCERHIVPPPAVEHIMPKGRPEFKDLEGCWENFLLACTNCNSTKGTRIPKIPELYFPDRDNTFVAFVYEPDGMIRPARSDVRAGATLTLTGLDKRAGDERDANGKRVAIDRGTQRMNTWGLANDAAADIEESPHNQALRKRTISEATACGFFSIWMTVFANDIDMRNRLIDAFPGTRDSGCFDPITTEPVTPAPNPDGLPHGSKI